MQSTNGSTHAGKDYALTSQHELLFTCNKPQAACRYYKRVWHRQQTDLSVTYAALLLTRRVLPSSKH